MHRTTFTAFALALVLAAPLAVGACSPDVQRGPSPVDDPAPHTAGPDDDAPTPPGVGVTGDHPVDPPPANAGEGEGEGEGEAGPDDVDDATIVDVSFPSTLDCGAASTAMVTVQNTGTTTWTAAGGYKLGAVDDSDPLAPGRVVLAPGDAIAPGDTHAFTIPLLAPSTPASAGGVTSDWRMVRELLRWFGDTTSHDVDVTCAEPPPAPPGFDWSQVTIENSPDVSSWAETARITRLDLAPDGVHVEFTKKDGGDSWPDVPFGAPGDSLEYTLWIVIDVDGQWYASGCIEYWRGLDKNGGPPNEYAQNWYYDAIRWGPMVGHQPAVGETVGFLVTAGDARNNGNALVHERSNVVFVPFPDAAGFDFTF